MAAPAEVTLDNLSGKFVMNKTISTNPEPALTLQGIGWLTRKAIGLATVTLTVKEYLDEAGLTHIDIDQVATGGIKGTSEYRVLDGEPKSHDDHIFGSVVGRSRFVKMSEVGQGAEPAHLGEEDKKWLTTGWGAEFGSPDVKVMENYVVNEKSGWVAWAVWGFDEVGEGESKHRRYVRHQVVKSISTGEAKHLLLAYDWQVPS